MSQNTQLAAVSEVMAIINSDADREFATQIANAIGYPSCDIIMGGIGEAAAVLGFRDDSPNYILIDIGNRSHDIFPELDMLAQNCGIDTRVVIIGEANDVSFYRELLQRGILEYFTKPAKIADIRAAFMYDGGVKPGGDSESTVLAFMGAASGDGSSTVAMNTAYCLANDHKQPTVLVDLDFQFGMLARNLDLSSPFGIRELFEHPDRTIDNTLLERMVVSYGNHLKVIAAPNDLRLWPQISPETIRDLLNTLRENYSFVILDIPHIWSSWVSAALMDADECIMVAQLWLRSVTHSARLLGAWRDIGIDDENISVVINRSGAKFKEEITAKDYERVCSKRLDFYFANDIRSIVSAENQVKAIPELGNVLLARQFKEFSSGLYNKHKKGINSTGSEINGVNGGLFKGKAS